MLLLAVVLLRIMEACEPWFILTIGGLIGATACRLLVCCTVMVTEYWLLLDKATLFKRDGSVAVML